MCVPAPAETTFKTLDSRSRCIGKILAAVLVVHLLLALSRAVSMSYSMMLSDIMLVVNGYFVTKRFFPGEAGRTRYGGPVHLL